MTKKDAASLAQSARGRLELLSDPATARRLETGSASPVVEPAPAVQPASLAKTVSAGPASEGYLEFAVGRVFEPGERVAIPLGFIVENPKNPRVFFQPDEDFERSLLQDGQLVAAQVYPADRRGMFMLKSGHRRAQVLRKHAKSVLLCEVVSRADSILEEYRQSRAINSLHKAQTYLDDAVRYRELLDEGVVQDQATLAREFSLAEGTVSKLLSIGELPFVALEYMAANVQSFPHSISYLLYQYWNRNREDIQALISLMHDVVDHKLSVRQVEATLREDAEQPRKRRERPLSQTVFKGDFSGSLKYYNSRLTLELGELKGSRGERLYAQISEIVQQHATNAASARPIPSEDPPT